MMVSQLLKGTQLVTQLFIKQCYMFDLVLSPKFKKGINYSTERCHRGHQPSGVHRLVVLSKGRMPQTGLQSKANQLRQMLYL